MSRVGKNPVNVPSGVQVKVQDGAVVASGKLGELSMAINDNVDVTVEENEIKVTPKGESKKARAMWGTTRSLLQNMVTGVSEGFTQNLEITGVGYRAQVQGQNLNLQLGYSHDIVYPIPQGITVKCEKPTSIAITGASKREVGQMAAEIRSMRPPEPYKGKGVRYADEQILRKEGKKK